MIEKSKQILPTVIFQLWTKMKFVDVLSHFCHVLCHWVEGCSFMILSINSKMTIVIIKEDFHRRHVRKVVEEVTKNSINLRDVLATKELIH